MSLTEEQQRIFNAVKESKQPFIFIQGKAGTGKSYLIREIQEFFGCDILVPTNMAKSIYQNNKVSTVYSFFAGELDDFENGYQDSFNYKPKNSESIRKIKDKLYLAKYLILDEISMVRADLFEMINKICQSVKENHSPFGGIKIIIVGDILQLPPIVPEDEDNAVLRYLKDNYGGIYFFNSKVIQDNLDKIDFFEMKESKRHADDPEYEKLLDILREPKNTEVLRTALEKINQRVVAPRDIPKPEEATIIVTTNSKVEEINTKQLSLLPGEEQRSFAKFEIYKKNTLEAPLCFEGTDLPSKYNTQEYYPLDIPSKFTPILKYKIGSKVMFTDNFKRDEVFNGEFGIIKEIRENSLIVQSIKHKKKGIYKAVEIKKKETKRKEIFYNDKTKKIKVGNIIQKTIQYPLKSGYAFTVHKSQGQTYPKVVIDLNGKGMFAYGQLYVALSRAKSLNGLFLTKRLTISDCMVSLPLIGFLNQMRTNSKLPIIPAEMLTEETLSNVCQEFKNIIFKTKLTQGVKEDIFAILQYYNNSYEAGKYQFAISELERILDKIDSACTDKEKISQIRQSMQENATKESCDSIIKRIIALFPFITQDKTSEIFPIEHHTLIADQDKLWAYETPLKLDQIGITYEGLFAKNLQGATLITIREPFLIYDYQLDNLREFIDLLLKIRKPDSKMTLRLITRRGYNGKEQEKLRNALGDIIKEKTNKGINLEFDNFKEKEELHDRDIVTDTGWKIILGKGLHIWNENQNTERELKQSNRPCIEGCITYLFKTIKK